MDNRFLHLAISVLALLALTQASSAQRAEYNPPFPAPPLTPAVPQLPNTELTLLPFGSYFFNVQQKQNQQLLPPLVSPNLNPQLIQQQKDQEFLGIVGRPPLNETGQPARFMIHSSFQLPVRGYIPYPRRN